MESCLSILGVVESRQSGRNWKGQRAGSMTVWVRNIWYYASAQHECLLLLMSLAPPPLPPTLLLSPPSPGHGGGNRPALCRSEGARV